MKVLRDLTIHLKEIQVEKMIEKIDALLPTTWTRDEERESELAEKHHDIKQHCYSTINNPNLPKARLWLAKARGKLYVSNIVPDEMGRLNYEEYNSILLSFVEVLKKDLSIKYSLTKEDITLEDFMPKNVSQKLINFSRIANRSTGYGHPCDFERWLDFAISFYKSDCERKFEWLKRWLNEEEGWLIEEAYHLSSQLEYALDVLDYYKKNCNGI